MKKLVYALLGVFVALLCVTQASGLNDSKVIMYYSFENSTVSGSTIIDDAGNINATKGSGITTGQAGQVNDSFLFDATSNAKLTLASQLDLTAPYAITFWAKTGSYSMPLGMDGTTDDNIRLDPGTPQICFEGNTNGVVCWTYAIGNGWRHYAFIGLSNGSVELYVDGSYDEALTPGSVAFSMDNVGSAFSPSYEMDGNLDELMVYNGTLNATEVELLYNGTSYPFEEEPEAGTIFSITLADEYDSTAINTFNVTINGTVYSTTNGTIYTPFYQNDTLVFNVTFYTSENGGYFNKTYYDHVADTNLAGTVHQAEAHFLAYQLITEERVYNGSFSTVSSPLNDSTLLLKAGNYTFTFNRTSYYNQTVTQEVGALANITVSIYNISNAVYNFTAQSYSGTPITNFTVNISLVHDTYSYNISYSTTNGSIEAYLIQGNFTLIVDPSSNNPQYEVKTQNDTLDSTWENYVFVLLSANAFNLQFLDEETLSVLDTINISVEFISDDETYTSSTVNGTFFVDGLTAGDYTIRYGSQNETVNYNERFYYVTLEDLNSLNLTLYLLKNVGATNVTYTVYDSLNREVEGAIIKVQRFNPSTNAYLLVAMAKTNFEGISKGDIVLNSEYYKFILEYDGTVKKTTNPTYIYATDLTFKIDLGSEIAQDFYQSTNIIATLDFDNATNLFNFDYNDVSSQVSEGCLYIYEVTYDVRTLVNESCTEAAAATIFQYVINASEKTFQAEGIVTLAGEEILIASYSFTYPDTSNELGKWGILIVIILTVIFGLVGFSWNAVAGIILLPVPIFIASLPQVQLISIGIAYTLPLVLICMIIAYIISEHS